MRKNGIKNKSFQITDIKKIFIITIMINFFIIVPFSTLVFADAAAEYGFDFMETFDNIPDWQGTSTGYNYNRGPNDIWSYYSCGGTSIVPNDPWIGDHGTENVWGGTGKSLRMQVGGGSSRRGPSRFGLYFGSDNGEPCFECASGKADSGYDEVYVFYMVKMHANQFPESGGTYDSFSYYKFHVMGSAFLNIENTVGADSHYGGPRGHPHIIRSKTADPRFPGEAIVFLPRYVNDGVSDTQWTTNYGLNDFLRNEEWFGVEFHYKMSNPPGSSNGHWTIWIYDNQGNATKIFDKDHLTLGSGQNFKFNKFNFGGNRSFDGSTEPTYYVDDFIINASRIGPTYFAKKLGGGSIPDTTPPSRSNGSPSGMLSSGTANTDISMNTNESSDCRYSATSGVDFNSMNNNFSVTGNTSHSTTITGLQDGQDYIYYVRCQDAAGNSNTNDYLISFSVDSGSSDTTPPSRSNGSPVGTLSSGTPLTILSVNTNESSVCRYSTTSGVEFNAMNDNFSITGNTSHSTTITSLQDGQSYSYYVRCQDSSGNSNTNDYLISFSVDSFSSDIQSPSIPDGLAAQVVSSSRIDITWNASTDNIAVTGYTIYSNGSQIATTTDTTYQMTGLSPLTTYTYTISAYDSAGNSSSQSSSVTATTSEQLPTQTTTVINVGDIWKYFKGNTQPASGWNNISFNDSLWLQGTTGIGYGDGDDETILSDMINNYITVYGRKIFSISAPSSVTNMNLIIDYDDGFVAYLNGQEVARSVMPSGTPNYNTIASTYHEAGTPETFDLTPYINSLVAGTNVLAIEVHNRFIDNSDFSMIPELVIECTSTICNEIDTTPPAPPLQLQIVLTQ